MNRTRALLLLLVGCSACTIYLPGASEDDDSGVATDTVSTLTPVAHQCTFACSASTDCASATGMPADDFACVSGACVSLGCQSDSECTAGLVCLAFNGAPPTCTQACASQSDCASTYSGTFEADELACVNGGCLYTGCTSSDECSHLGTGLACLSFGGAAAACVPLCNLASDCVSAYGGRYGADEFTCEQGGCRLWGCQSNTECPASAFGSAPVCG